MDFCVDESPAAKALGPLFKLTEVHLWDDGSSEVPESSYVQEPIKLDRDGERNNCTRSNGFSGAWPDDIDVELAKQMNDLGLPLTFRTNKGTSYGMTSGKRKGSTKKSSQRNCNEIDDYMPDSTEGGEEESKSPASVLNTSEMLDQSDQLKIEIVAGMGCLPNLSLKEGVSLSSGARASTHNNEHEYNDEASKLELDACFGCVSELGNEILSEAESIPCTKEMVATVGDCHPKEIYGELDGLHQETSLVMDHDADGRSNDTNLEVIKDSDVAPSAMNYSFGEWVAYWDDFHMRSYFYNVVTEESTWDPPLGMEHLVYSNVADESTSTGPGLSELENEEMDIGMSEEVQASCDLQLVQGLAKESTDDAHLLGEQLDEISGDWVSADNVSSAYNKNKKKKSKRSRSKMKLSISSKDHLGISDERPSSIIGKYWWQRYMLFSRFDNGIKMDEEGWFSVTPETLAKHHADRCGYGAIVDLFTGVGGNAIQFAQRSRHVIAIDIDPIKVDYARHNAALYGVDDRIDFINGDCFDLAPKLKADTVFLSPPWGGPDYSKVTKFDINSMLKPRDGKSLFDAGKGIASKVVMFLPRNVDINQLAELSLSAVPPWSLEVEKNYLNGRLKAVTAYFCDPSIS